MQKFYTQKYLHTKFLKIMVTICCKKLCFNFCTLLCYVDKIFLDRIFFPPKLRHPMNNMKNVFQWVLSHLFAAFTRVPQVSAMSSTTTHDRPTTSPTRTIDSTSLARLLYTAQTRNASSLVHTVHGGITLSMLFICIQYIL